MTPKAAGRAAVAAALDPRFTLTARDAAGRLLGFAGVRTAEGACLALGWPGLRAGWGVWGGAWRALALAPLERPVEAGRLLMDGIAVLPEARGRGAGTALLAAVVARARAAGCGEVRLDVIDSNPRARALYEREGFAAAGRERLGPLARLYGFREATTMVKRLGPEAAA
jgi:Acetyltransferases